MMEGNLQQLFLFGEFELDTNLRCLKRNGEKISLHSKTYELLLFLLKHNGEIISKNEILDNVWADQFVEEANLAVQISTLRKILGEKKNEPKILLTIPGKGYKFIADVIPENDEIIIQKHKVSHILIEEEIEHNSEIPNYFEKTVKYLGNGNKSSKSSFVKTAVFSLMVLLVGIIIFYGIKHLFYDSSPSIIFDKQPKIRKLTNNGKVGSAIISPDGKFFVYVSNDKPFWQTSIHLAQTDGASDVVLLPTTEFVFRLRGLSADGKWVYYTASKFRSFIGTLYKIPILGGVPQKVLDKVSVYTIISPDETKIAFFRSNSQTNNTAVIVKNLNDSNEIEFPINAVESGYFNNSLTWSADGQFIAFSVLINAKNVGKEIENYDVYVISLRDNQVKPLTNQPWNSIVRLEWLNDGSGLLLIGREKESGFKETLRRGLYSVDYPSGKYRKLLADLNTYGSSALNLTKDARTILVEQGESESNIWLAPAENLAEAKQITFGSAGRIDGWYGLDWTSDGKLVYVAWIDDSSTIWIMDSDGSNQKQLTQIGFQDEKPTVTADGKTIVFQSNRSRKNEIWRMEIDGSNLTQLTNGEGNKTYPSLTPDGKWIFYINEQKNNSSIWKIPIEGGESVKFVDKEAAYPRVSPDGNFVACGYKVDKSIKLAIISINGGEPIKTFDFPPTYNLTFSPRWTIDGQNITYRDWVNGIWQQSIAGGEPIRLKGLPEEKLLIYNWSKDGKQFAFTRQKEPLDVVLISDFK
jgi:Tol biopolymer transport system component/DNA-binding winged helix-turn-helix (wHTH) protein